MNKYSHSKSLEHAILSWLNSFETKKKATNFLDLKTGYQLMEILTIVSSKHFSIDSLDLECTSWALIHKNLAELYSSLRQYHEKELQYPLDSKLIDILVISKNNDRNELMKLVELIFSVCLGSSKLEFFVHNIMNMEEADQLLLKELIERILQKPEPQSGNNPLGHHEHDLIAATLGEEQRQKKERELLTTIDELENDNGLLKKKINEMSEEASSLVRKVKELSEALEEKNSEIKRVLYEKEKIQKDMFRMAGVNDNDEYILNVNAKESKIQQLEILMKEIRESNEQEKTHLQDEIDCLKKKMLALPKLESNLEHYKSKYEESKRVISKSSELMEANNFLRKSLEEQEKLNLDLNGKIVEYRKQLNQVKEITLDFDVEISKKNNIIDQLNNDIAILKSKLSKKEETVNELERKIESMTFEESLALSARKMEPSGLNKELADLLNDYDEKKEAELADYKRLITDLRENRRGDIECLEAERDLLQNKCAESSKELDRLRKEVNKYSSMNDYHEISDKCEQYKREIMEEKLKTKKIEKTLNESLEKALVENQKLNRLVKNNERKLGELVKEVDELKEKNLGYINKDKEKSAREKAFLEEIAGLKADVRELEERECNLKDKIRESSFTASDYRSKDDSVEKLKKKVANLTSELESLNKITKIMQENHNTEVQLLISSICDIRMKYEDIKIQQTKKDKDMLMDSFKTIGKRMKQFN